VGGTDRMAAWGQHVLIYRNGSVARVDNEHVTRDPAGHPGWLRPLVTVRPASRPDRSR
jgi:hypothetical protein